MLFDVSFSDSCVDQQDWPEVKNGRLLKSADVSGQLTLSCNRGYKVNGTEPIKCVPGENGTEYTLTQECVDQSERSKTRIYSVFGI